MLPARDVTEALDAFSAGVADPALCSLLAAVSNGVVRFDVAGQVTHLNSMAETLTGFSLVQAFGRPLIEIYPEAAAGGRWRNGGRPYELPGNDGLSTPPSEHLLTRPDGSQVLVREHWAEVAGEGGWLVLEDLTPLRRLEERLEWQALHDPITDLLNRRGFEAVLEAAIEEVRTLGGAHVFGYLELDDFELINDAYGQLAGDELLRQAAHRVSGRLGEDEHLGRLAGERFGLLLRNCPPAQIGHRAAELRRAVTATRFLWQGERFETGASIGMVPIDPQVGDLYEVLGAADAALEMARESAAETHSFDPENSQDIRLAEHYGEMRWLGRIDRALRHDQFRLYRQPIVRAAQPRVSEAPLHEVLIRMLDDEGRVIAPGSFIPAAERFQLIAGIDRWVVTKALELLGREVERDPRVSVALNVSGQSLGDASFHDFVAGELLASRVDPWRLCFEITETAAVSNLERARRFIMRLRERGCRFILDDFGSGMSSFAYLKNLPVDFLKIDGGFIREMLDDAAQLAIVRAIHQVGRALGLATIAEMIESRAQLDAASEIGVDYVQGYFIRHPEPWLA